MKKLLILLPFIAFVLVCQSGCIKSSVIGDDILKEDEIGIDFVDTFSIVAKTGKNDSLRVFSGYNTLLLGELENSIIGKANASIYCDFFKPVTIPGSGVNESNLDSIVMTFFVDTSKLYGNVNSELQIEVYELEDNISHDKDDTIYSFTKLQYKSTPIGTVSFIPSEIDTIKVIEPEEDTVKYANRVRMTLDYEFGKRFLQDTLNLTDADKFKGMFKGIFITSSGGSNSMISLQKDPVRIEVYFTDNSELEKMSFTSNFAVPNFVHDYAGSEVETAFDDVSVGEDFFYSQGMEGVKTEMEILNLDILKDKNINKAELILYTVKEMGVIENLPPVLYAYYYDENGSKKLISDAEKSLNTSSNYGYLVIEEDIEENGINTVKYRINLTLHLKQLIRDEEFNMNISLLNGSRSTNPGFAKFYGTNNSDLQPKLRVIYSEKD